MFCVHFLYYLTLFHLTGDSLSAEISIDISVYRSFYLPLNIYLSLSIYQPAEYFHISIYLLVNAYIKGILSLIISHLSISVFSSHPPPQAFFLIHVYNGLYPSVLPSSVPPFFYVLSFSVPDSKAFLSRL